MARITLRGITWNHRRAIDPLLGTSELFVRQHPDIAVNWDKRPLSSFEFTPVDRLAEEYDFIILDHTFCGAVAASGSLLPLNEIVANIGGQFVGPSLASYRMDGNTWALPVDAATQVQVFRPDLLNQIEAEPPVDWQALLTLGHRARRHDLWLAIGLKGVHSLMTFFTLTANLGNPCGTTPDEDFCDRATALEALALMRALLNFCPPQSLDWNSIGLHDAMVERDDLILCPAVYCYATYAEQDQRRPLRFLDFPGPNGFGGTTAGGTGLGISARCRHIEAALDYVRFAAEAPTQIAFAHHHGQPARVEAWEDPGINEIFGGCYHNTRATQDSAWVRPRYNGYLAFQEKAGGLMETHLREATDPGALIDRLMMLHQQRGRG